MDLLAAEYWSSARAAWVVATKRLHAGPTAGTMGAAVVAPLVDHFERAWTELGVIASLAARFVAPPETRPLPVQHLAAFVGDDLLDVFRGAASEVALLIPDGSSWNGDPSPTNIVDEIERFDRYLALAGMAAVASGSPDPLTAAVCKVAETLREWSAELPAMVAPIREILETMSFGSGAGSSAARRSRAN